MKALCSIFLLAVALQAQTPKNALLTTTVNNITLAFHSECGGVTDCLDNRSVFLRRNVYHSFEATGPGTWSVQMKYADGSPSGFTSFGSTALVTQASNPNIGFGNGYHDYINFSITGANAATVVVTYGGIGPNLFFSTSVGSAVFPCSIAQGCTGQSTASAGFLALAGASPSAQLQYLRSQPNAGNLTTFQWAGLTAANAADFNFSAQTPGGTLSAGPQTITLAPCPLGVTGTQPTTGHYQLWISGGGGAGSNEVVPITGGTCAGDGINGGTVIVTVAACGGGTCHSGAWTAGPATAGIQEAAVYAIANGVQYVQVPAGNLTIHGTVNVAAPLSIIGAGYGLTSIATDSATLDMFQITATGTSLSPVDIRGIFFTSSTTRTAGSGVNAGVSGAQTLFVNLVDDWFENQYWSVNLFDCEYVQINHTTFHQGATNGTYVRISNPNVVDGGDNIIADNWFFGNGASVHAIDFISGNGIRVTRNKFLQCNFPFNGVVASGAVQSEFNFSENMVDQPATIGVLLTTADSTGLITDFVISNNIWGGLPTDSFVKINSNGATVTRGSISGNTMIFNSGTGTGLNFVGSMSAINISANSINQQNSGGKALVIPAGMAASNVSANVFQTFANAGFTVSTSAGVTFSNNIGITDIVPGVNTASTLTLPLNPNIALQSSNAVTAVVGPTAAATTGTFTSAGTPSFSAGASIGNTGVMVANQLYGWLWDGTKLWIVGPGFSSGGGGGGATIPHVTTLIKGDGAGNGATALGHDVANIITCVDSSGSATSQVCSTSPTFTPAAGDAVIYKTSTTNTGDLVLAVNGLTGVHVRKFQGTSVLSSGDLIAGIYVPLVYDGTYWEIGSDVGNGFASAAFSAITSGTNSAAAMVITTGASLGTSGSGTNTANSLNWLNPSTPTFNSGGTTTCVFGQGLPNVCKVIFSGGNTTLAVSGMAGGPYGLISIQDGTGSRTYSSFPGTLVGATQPDPGASMLTMQEFKFDGVSNYNAGTAFCPTCLWRGSFSPEGTVPACSSYSGFEGLVSDSTNHVYNVCQGGNKAFLSSYAVNAVAFSSTPNFDFSKGSTQSITLTGNVSSSTFSNLLAGMTVTFHICQDGSGSHTFVFPTGFKAPMTIGATASKCSDQTFQSPDGTNVYSTSVGVLNQ